MTISSASVDCCVVCDTPLLPPPSAFVYCCIFSHFSTSIPADCCICLTGIDPPHTPVRIPIDCCVLVCCCVASCGPSFPSGGEMSPRAVVGSLVPSLSAVMVTATVAESTPTTPPSIVEAFVMVLVGFGVVWLGLGGYLEAAGHCRGGRCGVRWG